MSDYSRPSHLWPISDEDIVDLVTPEQRAAAAQRLRDDPAYVARWVSVRVRTVDRLKRMAAGWFG